MSIFEAILLGIIEGITEFLPISSTGHLTIAEKLLGFSISDPAITAFTAVIQIGAVLATVVYFWSDILRIIKGWIAGLFSSSARGIDYRFGWAVIIGSVPIAIVGLAFKSQIETTLRSLWLVAIALILWSGVMWLADKLASQKRSEKETNWRDTLIIGIVQCIALIPGVSRSGATISAGLFRDFDRVTATKLSFFLAIPALLAAGMLEAVTKADGIAKGVGWVPTIVATVVSFLVAYLSVAWLLKFISRHSYQAFVIYRLILGTLLIILLASGVISAT